MSDDSLIHEIEETIKQEKLEKLWKEYGIYLIMAAVLVVLVTALVTGWRSWNEKINITQTEALIQSLDAQDRIGELDKIVAGLRPGHRAAAHLTAAGLLLQNGDKEAALAHYSAVYGNKDIDPVFRDLAFLMAVRLDPSIDGKAGNGLSRITSDPKSPWRWHAHLQSALMLAQDSGDYARALEHLDAVMDAAGAPPSLRERARALHHVYGLEMTHANHTPETKNKKEEPEG